MAALLTRRYVYYSDAEKSLQEGGWKEIPNTVFTDKFKVFTHKKFDYYIELKPEHIYWCMEYFI